ncbi:phospho-N-acetylmuramoyl-pentapeptide-transferase [Helicobacter ailurogastricus]|uniref:Phospho-N-acetylmuramoyl-pentapeptide-transferase n=1 Tax=Helicobacter ailurogastricus TaxID=1578720 RepID=A0A0K2XET0_9HELI|nr:phospho-N-acetylmuramoyl-pentapeptide-transferase [Helicobacter ailurogastricus]CRF41564.1 Phospho-N-acetylmuramoyl-pentapeptide-transferase [Helicobacter ailurogastricus]CRF43249.1 Phospho-N-acetylmuramoyl-pentapeptide-transferase [Helicobacter ailurogastricus]CRF44949.1 Phospho-N-acetylmuramoyl-pentapeptide-transferase [Helicobacter ailurogastricus]GLH57647.1 Phospho-N-acetylmuramoyl-pentapeptide-transferase MraY [Helicobacter ailurogastricus]GLH59761.1 Phospho-N-acetylmuramoyl-pentapepti
MLYYLYPLLHINLFQYLTFRSGLAFFLGFFGCVFAMPKFIAWAKAKKANQPISVYIPHQNKQNTPTMGGVVFIATTLAASLLTARLDNLFVLLGLAVLVGFGLIGMQDDYTKISRKSNAGVTSRYKFGMLALLSFLITLALAGLVEVKSLYFPFLKNPIFSFEGHAFLLVGFWMLVFLSTSNAVNLTDGLDGLATVPSICVIVGLSVFIYVVGNAEFSKYLLYPKVSHSGEVMVVAMALVGALLGFLWFNSFPAEVFMGDSGSLAIGGFIAYMAIITNNEILLILMGSVFVLEAGSVILQITSYKTRKKRIFRMAPLHHHFESKGWPENKIILRFWIIALLSNIVALLSLKVR